MTTFSETRAQVENDFAEWVSNPQGGKAPALAAFASLSVDTRDIFIGMCAMYVAGSGEPLPYDSAISIAEATTADRSWDWTTSTLPTLALFCLDIDGIAVSSMVVQSLAPRYHDLTKVVFLTANLLNATEPVTVVRALNIPASLLDDCWERVDAAIAAE